MEYRSKYFFRQYVLERKTKPVSVEREQELASIIQAEAQTIEALKRLIRRSRNKLSYGEKDQLVRFIEENITVREAINELVSANLGFAVKVASEYLNRGIPEDDLISMAVEGLTIAAFRYKPNMGAKFISYAVWWVRQVILDALEHDKIVRPPLNKIWGVTRLSRCDEQLTQVLGRHPTSLEVQEELGLSRLEYAELRAVQSRNCSLNTPVHKEDGDEEVCWEDLVADQGPSPEDCLDEEDIQKLLNEFFDRVLTDEDSEVLKLYFGLDGREEHTLEEIGTMIGVTRERVRQRKEKILKRLKAMLIYKEYRKIRTGLSDAFLEIKGLY